MNLTKKQKTKVNIIEKTKTYLIKMSIKNSCICMKMHRTRCIGWRHQEVWCNETLPKYEKRNFIVQRFTYFYTFAFKLKRIHPSLSVPYETPVIYRLRSNLTFIYFRCNMCLKQVQHPPSHPPKKNVKISDDNFE